VPAMPGVKRIAAMCLVAAACSASSPATTTTVAGSRALALDYAASADRALDGTAFSEVAVGEIADAVVAACAAADPRSSIAATVGAIDVPSHSSVDDEILTEVLTEGVREVCPDRAGATALVAAYVAAVRDAVTAADPGAAIDEDAVLTAGPVACDLLDRDQGPEPALLAVVATLFGVEAGSVDELETRITGSQGVVAGATLGAAVTYLCSGHQAEVSAFLEDLGS